MCKLRARRHYLRAVPYIASVTGLKTTVIDVSSVLPYACGYVLLILGFIARAGEGMIISVTLHIFS